MPERRAAAARFGVEAVDLSEIDDTAGMLIDLTDGRGPDAVIDAVGMEAHGHDEAAGSKLAEVAQRATGLLPDRMAQKITDVAAVDRLDALHVAVKAVRRGGTVSVSGVYGGEVDPMPMMEMFDRGIQLRMGQAHVKRWIDDLLPLVADSGDPLGVQTFATHHLPLEQAPARLRDVPEEGRRLHQGRPAALEPAIGSAARTRLWIIAERGPADGPMLAGGGVQFELAARRREQTETAR